MRVLVTCIEDPGFDHRGDAHLLNYDADRSVFSLPHPIGDDWLQRIEHRPWPVPPLVRVEEQIMFVVFEKRADAQAFGEWLARATKESENGFRTMRG